VKWTWLPLPSAVPVDASHFVNGSLGFTLGWDLYQFAIGVPIEISAATLVIDYWPHNISSVVYITVLYVDIFAVNSLPMRVYSELEFFLGSIKLITILGLIMFMCIITLGGGPSNDL
jgi:amino acid transporter